jgi:hypothetical protein
MSDTGLGKSNYTKKQLDAFAAFQDSQGTRRAYLAKTGVLAFNERNDEGNGGLPEGPKLKPP